LSRFILEKYHYDTSHGVNFKTQNLLKLYAWGSAQVKKIFGL